MCGLAGVVSVGRKPDLARLELAGTALRHRGPDSSGIMLDERCGLVHRRLSILDLSAAGHQPMQADNLPVWIVYNGEIYNHSELRERLRGLGWTFRSSTDTEVILKGYVEWGPQIFGLLRGMYAIGIWDARARTLTLARDQFGIKPLYYWNNAESGVVFGSELKALRAFESVPDDIDWSALGQFLRYQCIPEPLSIHREIRQVPAGHTLIWGSGQIRLERHVKLADGQFHADAKTASEDEVFATLQESVARHMIADVPVGAFLSGGVDSSLVVALMRRATTAPIHTFSIVFGERFKAFDEREHARLVAKHLATEHHEIQIEPSIVDRTEEVLGFFDEPFANPAALIASALCEYTAGHVKVALSGVGGDEFFGGYPRYLAVSWQKRVAALSPKIAKAASKLLVLLPTSTDRKWVLDRAKRLTAAALADPAHFYDDLTAFAVPEVASKLLAPDIRNLITWRDPVRIPSACEVGDPSWAMSADVESYLPSDLLTYTDRCAMAYSLEVRTPLVDREVAGVSNRVETLQKLKGLQTKWLLKRLTARLVPPSAVYRKKKGFSVPVSEWIRGDLKSLFDDALSVTQLRNAPELDSEGIQNLIAQHHRGDNSVTYLLWSVFVYMLWHTRRRRHWPSAEAMARTRIAVSGT
jgi:asparagine synthase (glutamine-hydrolysing)